MAKEEPIKEKIQIATIEQVILANLQSISEKIDALMELAKQEMMKEDESV